MKLYTRHDTLTGPNRVRTVYHFTRGDMLAGQAKAMRQTAKDLPSKEIVVYESEEVLIVERNLV
jgi:hypothetical protein